MASRQTIVAASVCDHAYFRFCKVNKSRILKARTRPTSLGTLNAGGRGDAPCQESSVTRPCKDWEARPGLSLGAIATTTFVDVDLPWIDAYRCCMAYMHAGRHACC